MQISLPIVFVVLCVQKVTPGSSAGPCSSARSRVLRDSSGSSRLRELDLSHSDLMYLYNGTFLELNVTELVKLNMANNLIWCIEQQAFLGLAELERLDLSGNNLTYIHPDVFSYTEKLFWLSLADNKFFTLPSQGIFFYGCALTFLDLSNCSVNYIFQQTFKGTQKVRYLNLFNNLIRSIQPGTFGPLKQLRCLDISFNSLTSLHIDLSFRNISVGDYLAIDNLELCLEPESSPSVLKLKADNNPWHCDCKMKHFLEYISK